MAPTIRPGPHEKLPIVPLLGGCQHLACQHCMHHNDLSSFRVGNDIPLVLKHGVHLLGWATSKNELTKAQQNSSVLQLDWSTLPPLAWPPLYIFSFHGGYVF
jgi:hypothetical protein